MSKLSAKDRVPPFSDDVIERISKILGDTTVGLTGSEIGHLLTQCKISDPAATATKWKRLHDAFVVFQNEHQSGIHIVRFIMLAMAPGRHLSDQHRFRSWQSDLNGALSLVGLYVNDEGKVARTTKARSISEAGLRANRLKAELQRRQAHTDVLRFCTAEILNQDYFHAVDEAIKSVSHKIREKSGLTCDGADLADAAFSLGKTGIPVLAINSLSSDSDRGEQRGFVNLLKGVYGTVRNPISHNARINASSSQNNWDMSEIDTLDILSALSLIHRKLDLATRLR